MDNSFKRKVDRNSILEEVMSSPTFTKDIAEMARKNLEELPKHKKITTLMMACSDMGISASDLLAGVFSYVEFFGREKDMSGKEVKLFIKMVDTLREDLIKKLNIKL